MVRGQVAAKPVSRESSETDHVSIIFPFPVLDLANYVLPISSLNRLKQARLLSQRPTMAQPVVSKTAIKIPGKRTRNTSNPDIAARKKIVSFLHIYK